MTLYTPLLMQAVTGDPAITYTAQDFRNITSALSPVEGIVWSTDLNVTQRGAGANMSVDVSSGKAMVQGDAIANQGTYICYSDATTNVAISAANATNPRIDIIIARVRDKQADGGTAYAWTIEAIAGTPAASPAVPATPGSAIKLAEVRVNANATSITTGNITDRRQLSGVGDVAKWDLYGVPAGGQNIPSGATTQYAFGQQAQLVGLTRSNTTITIKTPGRYVVHFTARLSGSTACNRVLTMAVVHAGSTTRRIANSITTGANIPLTAAGTVYLDVGDTITPFLFQDSGATLFIDDTQVETDFTGVWVGP